MWRHRASSLLVALWAGSLWTIGFLVAPSLFHNLNDNAFAGVIAGMFFYAEAWLSLCCGILLLWLMPARRTLVLAMLVCTLVGYFCLHPFLDEARAAGNKSLFGILHGVSGLIYLVQSLLAVVLVGWAPRADANG